MRYLIINSLICLLVFLTMSGCGNAQNLLNEEVKDSKTVKIEENKSPYKVGQVWSYKTRPNENESTFIIVKIDNFSKVENIIHIALRDLKIKNPQSPDGFTKTMNHLPFAKEYIDKSVDKMLKEKDDLPDFEEGYTIWKEGFDAKRAGFYTITIAEAAEIVEQSLNQ